MKLTKTVMRLASLRKRIIMSNDVYAFFEQKPAIFGQGVIGLRSLTVCNMPVPIYEWEEFKPFLKFRARDSLDF